VQEAGALEQQSVVFVRDYIQLHTRARWAELGNTRRAEYDQGTDRGAPPAQPETSRMLEHCRLPSADFDSPWKPSLDRVDDPSKA
jgi:hypothetical protein